MWEGNFQNLVGYLEPKWIVSHHKAAIIDLVLLEKFHQEMIERRAHGAADWIFQRFGIELLYHQARSSLRIGYVVFVRVVEKVRAGT